MSNKVKMGIAEAKLANAKIADALNILESIANFIDKPNVNDFKKIIKYLRKM